MAASRRTPVIVLGFIVLSLFASELLTFAYPYGIVSIDTFSYLELSRGFRLLSPNALDWWRTIPYGLLLSLSLRFSEPTIFIFWVQSFVFALNVGCVFLLAKTLFSSEKTGVAIAALFLIVQVIAMRAFFLNVELLTDPLFASLALLGVQLSLLGWVKDSRQAALAGACLLGVAAFLRPVGISLFPVWIVFFLLAYGRKAFLGLSSPSRRMIIACSFLLLAPTVFWSARNAYVYGTFAPTAFSSHELLSRVLPLVDDDDVLFRDVVVNEAFLTELRRFEEEVGGKKQVYYAWHRSEEHLGPFQFLEALVIREGFGVPSSSDDAARLRFQTEKRAGQLALRIIAAHPFAYMKTIAHDYLVLASRSALDTDPTASRFSPEFPRAYAALTDPQIADHLPVFYPQGIDEGRHAPGVARFLDAVCCNPVFEGARRAWHRVTGILEHLLFLAILGRFVATRRRRGMDAAAHLPVAMGMLFLTSSALFALTSIAERPLARYALPGEMPLTLFWLLFLLSLMHVLRKRRADRSSPLFSGPPLPPST